VSTDKELLDTAKDYFEFVSRFYEVIKSSAPHIYHSALELSPRDSIVRQNYYQWSWEHPTPQVVCGIPQSWDHHQIINGNYGPCTWSPCGRFISAQNSTSVEVWDSLTLEKHTSLQSTEHGELRPLFHYKQHTPSYSPDGHSMVGFFGSSIIIWDMQTGGVVKEIQCSDTGITPRSLVWSLDGQTIGAIFPAVTKTYWVAHAYDVDSGVRMSTGMLQSLFQPYLWSHNKSLQAMAIPDSSDSTVHINIFEIWPTFRDTPTENFLIKLDPCYRKFSVMSFSHTVYQVSAIAYNSSRLLQETLVVLDIQSSKVLLKENDSFTTSCFSPDGSLLVASSHYAIKIWKYIPEQGYTLWREFPILDNLIERPQGLQFSPTLSSVLISWDGCLEMQHLDDPESSSFRVGYCQAFSTDGTYVVTAPCGHQTITITNPDEIYSIEPGFPVQNLALTNNILLIQGSGQLVGWCLTEEGRVKKVSDDGTRDNDGRLWTKDVPDYHPEFWVDGSIGVLRFSGIYTLYYDTETGEELESVPVELPSSPSWRDFHDGNDDYIMDEYSFEDFLECKDPSKNDLPDTIPWYEEGWIKYHVGKYWHQFWLPVHWRPRWNEAHWLKNAATLRIKGASELAIIKFHLASPPP